MEAMKIYHGNREEAMTGELVFAYIYNNKI